jgi:hypothetical protein
MARLLWNFDLESQPDNIGPHDQEEYGIWQGTPLRVKILQTGSGCDLPQKGS